MRTIDAGAAQKDFSQVFESVLLEREPLQISTEHGRVVLIAEPEWRSIGETLSLYGIPKMRESILEGMQEPLADCDREMDL
jgi:antitoxin YefM